MVTPLADATETLVTPVADVAQTVVTPLAEATESAVTPLADATEAVVTPLADATETLVTPVADAAQAVVTPLVDTTETVVTPLAQTTDAVVTPIEEAATPVVHAAKAVTTPVVEVVEAAATPVAEATGAVTAPVTDGLVAMVPPPTFDPGDAIAIPAEEIANTVGAVSEFVGAPFDLASDTGVGLVAGVDEVLQGLAAPEAILPLDELFQTLPIAITIGIASLGASAIVRGGCSPGASVVFTNVRLIPCLASETVHRLVPAFSGGSGGSMAGTTTRRGASGTRPSSPSPIDVIREGFDRSVGRVVDNDGEGLRDGRLLAQVGMVLGLIYLAFLTVWFWATRLRWNPRDLS